MNNDPNAITIHQGAEVIGADGEKLGTVDQLDGDSMVVRKGFFFPKDHYIPTSYVASADDDHVYLSVTSEQALSQGWDDYQVGGSTTTMAESGVTDVSDATLDATVGRDPSLDTDEEPFQHEQDTQRTHINAEDELRIPIHEENLAARTREVERGAVRVEKDVVAEEQTLDVPVTEEEVHVTRRVVDRDAGVGDTAFEEGTIEVPLRGEEVEVEKRARVVEEVDVDKTAVERTQRVADTVRREEVHVEGENVDLDTDGNPVR